MKKSILARSLNEIKDITRRMPKTVNEAVHFEDEEREYSDGETYGDEMGDEAMPADLNGADFDEYAAGPVGPEEGMPSREEAEDEDEMPALDQNSSGAKLVDQIRKTALQGMADLADSPQLPEYEILKKIWQICDKNIVGDQKKEDGRGIQSR